MDPVALAGVIVELRSADSLPVLPVYAADNEKQRAADGGQGVYPVAGQDFGQQPGIAEHAELVSTALFAADHRLNADPHDLHANCRCRI
jgi:hypothetical protein